MTPADGIYRIRKVIDGIRQLERVLEGAVREAKQAGASWNQIGEVLGLSREDAIAKYASRKGCNTPQ